MEISEGIKWIGGTIITLLGFLGIGKLAEMRAKRKYELQDVNHAIHETNQTKLIDSQTTFRQSFVDRLGKVETNLEKVQEKLNSQLVMNAELKAENKSLKDERERSNKEIDSLRETNNKQAIQIVNLENELHRTQDDVQKYKLEIIELKKRFDDLDKVMK